MSAKLVLYNAVKAKLLAIKNDSGITIVKTAGHYNNQFDRINEEIQYIFPATFIAFTDIPWNTSVGAVQNNSTQEQKAQCNIEIHIGLKNLKDEADSFPEDIAIIDSINDQLNGLQDEVNHLFTPLKRIGETDDTNTSNIRHWVITYQTELHEKGYVGSQVDATDGGDTTIEIEITKNYV